MRLFLVLVSLALCVLTVFAVRGVTDTGTRITFYGFDGVGVVAGFLACIGAWAALGPDFSIALLAAFLLHEAGHVLAYRMIGHRHARFRLVPLISPLPISDQPLKTEGEAFFVALMGPGFSLAPMALALALSQPLSAVAPDTAGFLRVFAVTCGALNFVNLLPFWPLDGGRCARIAAGNFWPTLAPAMTAFMTGLLLMAAFRTGSLAVLAVAGVGAQSLLRSGEPARKPLGPDAGLVALSAYAFTMAAHFSTGWLLFDTVF